MTVVKRQALFLLGKKQKTKIKPTVRKKTEFKRRNPGPGACCEQDSEGGPSGCMKAG